ncbi:MAG: hypothetical protein LBU23_09710 [Planctomycetota bacterium]|jgi:gluconokinase|nr:hypothetical protein [Planctomycetota bacterium]
MLALVLESSTSAAKALLYDDREGALAEETETYAPEWDAGGRQDADQVFQATMRAGRKAAAGRRVDAIGIGGIWHSIVPCDRDMNPVERSCTWAFTGPDELCRGYRAQTELARGIYRRTGCMPNITYQPYAILHLIRNGFDPAGRLFASQAGLNFFRLTGERLETKSIVSGMGLLNTHRLVYDEEILAMIGCGPEQFGALADYRQTRPLTSQAAAALGVPSGIPVTPPHSDGALNQVGNGCMRTGAMTFSVGTSAAIRLSTDRPVLSDPPGTWCYVGAEDWLCGAATNGACNCVNWFKETVLENRWSFAELEAELPRASAASPVFLPFLFGERCPGWDDTRRAGFAEIRAGDQAATLFRGVLEGVLFNVFHCYKILTALAGEPAEIVMSGGILNSPAWIQMAADIFQREISLSPTAQASTLGGAALALRAAGALADVRAFGKGDLAKIQPRADRRDEYAAKFARYLEYYERGRR